MSSSFLLRQLRWLKTLIERFGGIQCEAPFLSDRLVLLVGHPGVSLAEFSLTVSSNEAQHILI